MTEHSAPHGTSPPAPDLPVAVGPPSDRYLVVRQMLRTDPADYIQDRRTAEKARDHTGGPISYRDIAADLNARLKRRGIPIQVSHEAVRNWHQAKYPDRPDTLKKGRRPVSGEPAAAAYYGAGPKDPDVGVVEAARTAEIRDLIKRANQAGDPPPAIFQAPDDAA